MFRVLWHHYLDTQGRGAEVNVDDGVWIGSEGEEAGIADTFTLYIYLVVKNLAHNYRVVDGLLIIHSREE